MTPTPIACADKLSKFYGPTRAVEDCTLEVYPGEVLGLLGPNGAGKTTLLRLWMGFLRPSGGQARVQGLDCWTQRRQVHQRLAYLPGEVRLFGPMTGKAVLELLSGLHPRGRLSLALHLAQMWQLDLTVRVDRASSGMRQKLALAYVCSVDVPLVLLDEPTSSLDPDARAEVLQYVRHLRDQGRAVVFSSHVLSEVERVSDRVAILHQGRLRCVETVERLRRRRLLVVRLQEEAFPDRLPEQVRLVRQEPGCWHLEVPQVDRQVLNWLAQWPVQHLEVSSLGLEELYHRVVEDRKR